MRFFTLKILFCCLIFVFTKKTFSQSILVFDQTTQQELINYELKKSPIIGTDDTLYTISYPDYKPNSFKYSTIKLKKEHLVFLVPSYLSMNEVVVSANKLKEKLTDLPRQIQLIDQKKIAFQNRQNTGDLIEQNGNVFLQKSQQGGGSPVIRGFESNRILLVIDGVRMNNATYRGGHLQNVIRIDQNILEKGEILFGAGSVIYGSDALGGVIYFETKTPLIEKFTNNAFVRYGTVNNENTFHYDVNLGFKKWAHLISLTNSSFGDLRQGRNRPNLAGDSIYQRNYYLLRINNKDSMLKNEDPSVQIGTKYSQYDLMYKSIFNQSKYKQHTLNFQLSNTNNVPRYDRLNEWKGKNYRSAEWYYGPELRTLASYQLVNRRGRLLFDDYKLILAYQYLEESRNDRSWQNVNLNQRNEFIHVSSLNIDFFKHIKRKNQQAHEFRYGIDFQHNLVNSNARSVNIVSQSINSIPTRYPDGGSNMFLMAAFMSHSWEVSKKLIVSDGLRFNYTHLNAEFNNKTFFPFLNNQLIQSNTAFNGNLGLVYLPKKHLKYFINASSAFRTPNLDDLAKTFESSSGNQVIVPNSDLKPELTYNLETGVNFVLFNKLKFDASLYYTYFDNAISLGNSTLNGNDSIVFNGEQTKVVTNQNSKQAYIYGYNFQLIGEFLRSLYFTTSLNYTYGRIVTGNTEYPLDHIPPIYGKTSLSYFKNKFSSEISCNYNGWKRIADYNLFGEDNPQYALPDGSPSWYNLNIKAQYGFGLKNKVMIQVGIDNITDLQYRVFASGMSAAGRNFWVCLRLKL